VDGRHVSAGLDDADDNQPWLTRDMAARVRIGIDTGGTFTDVVAIDESDGSVLTTKIPSTPHDPAQGFMAGVRAALTKRGLDADELGSIVHGTTVATNQLLEGKIERLGFITTEGYQFILEIARQSVPDGYGNSYFWVKPPRIVPAQLVRTVRGRLDHTGAEVRPFDADQARDVARWFRSNDVDTIGVCFLHSYANPAHELRMRDILAQEHPDAIVSISADVLREYREYERSMTTLVDVAVKPRMARYVAAIAAQLHRFRGRRVPFYVMKSNGGVLSADEVVEQPITTVLSGPAAGALGAALVASRAGYDRILTCDGGGTSTDVSVVLDGQPALTTEGSVGGYPSKIPMIDVVTVGAGGGSIATASPEGLLRVGPKSAGADPGPICYRRGGTQVTVTDAHVELGRIPPHLLGGEIPLDAAAARGGLAELGARLGLDAVACALGVLEVSAWNQADALRQVTVARGLDVRDFVLAAFGGSGPLLACRLVDILGLRGVVVPVNPGNLSAFGLLTVDVRSDYVQTWVRPHAELDRAELGKIYRALTERAANTLDGQGFARADHRYERTADLRYFGQAFEVRVPVPDGELDAAATDTVAAAFHAAHRALYGYDFATDPHQRVEWVNLRVSGVGPIRRPEPSQGPASERPAEPSGHRPVHFEADAVETTIYQRPSLGAGQVVHGPAVIEEFSSTLPVHPGFAARVDELGNLVVGRQ
jgi:N-methylhydantoinase A